jgi:LytS/YehU family sensor histidine kinase
MIWEGNLQFDVWIDKKLPWNKKPLRRLFVHLPTSLLFSVCVIYFSMFLYDSYVCKLPESSKNGMMSVSIVIGSLVSVLLLSIEIGFQFFTNWKNSLVEIEQHKKENIQAQLENLRNQINPHFLFNNLSVLSSLVYKDQDKAVDFINQLSKVYRYLLDNRNHELVTVETELAFIRSYTYLLQIRFGKNIVFNFEIAEDKQHLLIPPMALQILIENAIKHNEISSELPLTITIKTDDNYLVVINNLQLRTNQEPSSQTGLANIRSRYAFFTNRSMEVLENKNIFSVKIPLLSTK